MTGSDGVISSFPGVAPNGRAAFLNKAAGAADALDNFAGGLEEAATPDGKLLRAFAADEAKFSSPLVSLVPLQAALDTQKLPVAVDVADLAKKNRFLLVHFPFELRPQGPWGFNEVTVRVDFSSKQQGGRAPAVHAIFPSSKFQELLNANLSLGVGLDPNLEFSASTGAIAVAAAGVSGTFNAEASGHAKLSAALGMNPIAVRWKKALIKTSATGLEWVWWEIAGTTLGQGDDPRLMAVIQVPIDAGNVSATGSMKVTRYYHLFKQALKNLTRLPKVYQEFLEAGAPYVTDPVRWDLNTE